MSDETLSKGFYEDMTAGYAARAQADSLRALPIYHWSRPEVQYVGFRQRERFTRALLEHGLTSVADLDILDLGCGNGCFLRWLEEIGAHPAKLHGVEVMPSRAEEAMRRSPNLDFQIVNGITLPYADHSMDLIVANVVFSSIVESSLRERVAEELKRVLKPTGAFHLFDMRWVTPGSTHVVPIPPSEVQRLFPWARCKTWPLLLAPPAARRIAPSFPFLSIALERLMPWLNTHRYYLLRR